MKIMAFNGSPRKKKWNTVTLLKSALEGAASVGAETELVQLYDLDFSGCISCFSCCSTAAKRRVVSRLSGTSSVFSAVGSGCGGALEAAAASCAAR